MMMMVMVVMRMTMTVISRHGLHQDSRGGVCGAHDEGLKEVAQ